MLPWVVTAAAVASLIPLLPFWRSALPVTTTRLLSDIGTDASLVIDQGAAFALSPDGRLLTFVAQPAGGSAQLYVRRLDQLNATLLGGTVGARHPFFSPDGQWIAFFADGKLKKVPVGGGDVQTLCDVPQGRGGSWSPDGTIIFAPSARGPSRLQRVSAAGGVPEPVTEKPTFVWTAPWVCKRANYLLHREQFDVEDERRIRRNVGRRALRTVREIRRNHEPTQPPDTHAGHAAVPPLNHSTGAHDEHER